MTNPEIDLHLKPNYHFRNTLLNLSLACWLISLALPALVSTSSENSLSGITILFWGWLGIAGIEDKVNLYGVIAWWANPFYLWAIIRIRTKGDEQSFSAYMALSLATLTALLGSYAMNAVPTFTPVTGYGPGLLLWYSSILILTYVIARDKGHESSQKLIMYTLYAVYFAYIFQILWRAASSNDAEREMLPFYAAKRGLICSVEATILPIAKNQPSIVLETNNKQWLDALRNWNVNAIQYRSIEYRRAENESPESRKSPYMTTQPVSLPARYTLRVEGGYPYINKWEDGGGDAVQLMIIDNNTKKEISRLTYRREMNRRLGFCPSMSYFPDSRNEEAIQWLAPFITDNEMEPK